MFFLNCLGKFFSWIYIEGDKYFTIISSSWVMAIVSLKPTPLLRPSLGES